MLNLLAPVVMKGESWTFERYVDTLRQEQRSCLAWLAGERVEWHVPPGLKDKVADDGRLRPFFGDTVVVPLSDDEMGSLERLQTRLRERLDDLLAEPLDAETFHVTLHDLVAGTSSETVRPVVQAHRTAVAERLRVIRETLEKHPEQARVKLVATAVYPSVNTSIVVGLAPASDPDFRILINLYNVFEDVVRLSYWLRPHVTLDYFRPCPMPVGRLSQALHEADPPRLELDLDMRRLAWQRFESMNRYVTES